VANKPVTATAPSEQASFVDLVEDLITKPVQSTPCLADIGGSRSIILEVNGLRLQAHMSFDWVDPSDIAMASFLPFNPPGCGEASIAQAFTHVFVRAF